MRIFSRSESHEGKYREERVQGGKGLFWNAGNGTSEHGRRTTRSEICVCSFPTARATRETFGKLVHLADIPISTSDIFCQTHGECQKKTQDTWTEFLPSFLNFMASLSLFDASVSVSASSFAEMHDNPSVTVHTPQH